MSVDTFVRITEAVAQVLGAIGWPIAVVVVVRWFVPQLREMLGRDKVSVSTPGGFGISAERLLPDERRAVADDLIRAAASRGEPAESAEFVESTVDDVAEDPRFPRVRGAMLLWVDDHPENNSSEQHALERLGVRVDHAYSTEQALQFLERSVYSIVISDMGRKVAGSEDDSEAGLRLIHEMRNRRFRTPVILYTSGRNVKRREELVEAGAIDVINGPTALFERVLGELLAR